MNRLAKQLLFGTVYLVLLCAVGYGVYDVVVPDPTCFDGVMNQDEEGVDCGAVCGVLCGAPLIPLTVGQPELFVAGNDSDVLIELTNDNVSYGAARVDYVLTLRDGDGPLATRRGFTYVNPLETRYLVVTFPGTVGTADATVPEFEYDPDHIQWFGGRLSESSVVEFSITNDRLAVEDDGLVTYTAAVRNDSTFDFDEVDITVVLYGATGERVAVGSTVERTMTAGELRAFTVRWPGLGSVAEPVRARAEASTNVFDNDNFIRTYGGQERFQGFQ